MRRDRTPATLTPQHHGTQWQPGLSTVLNFPNFSLTTTVDWSTWYKPHTCPMSPPPHQVWDLHNTTTTTHFQHSDDAQKSGISKKTVNPISPNKARENKIVGNKTQRLLFHPKTKRSLTQSLSVCLSVCLSFGRKHDSELFPSNPRKKSWSRLVRNSISNNLQVLNPWCSQKRVKTKKKGDH
jgi:hypothetical protein